MPVKTPFLLEEATEMEVSPVLQWAAFGIFAFISIAGALGMATTMSMFRSGIFLMASFIGVAGLFILLLADLLALLQIMMYIGGMLVMILFMLLFSGDPGGGMMSTHMRLRGPEWFFSLGLARSPSGTDGNNANDSSDKEEDQRDQARDSHQEEGEKEESNDMSMFTPAKRGAAGLALGIGVLLIALLLWRPHWAVVAQMPDPDSPRRIGHLLMDKYMIAFEGAGLLILLGIFGAVLLQRPGKYPDSAHREELRAAVEDAPAPVKTDPLKPLGLDRDREK
ncbi:NADH-quinone oxidoreductase subunit J family protein [Nitrosococcus oceani]|nr:NADH-quinone oxidoreductase subunit J [Nitrosococcus oceani]